MYLANTICSHHTTTIVAYCEYVPITMLPKCHNVYPDYTICSHRYTAKLAYSVSCQHNMLPSLYNQRNLLFTLHTHYATRKYIVYPAYTICYPREFWVPFPLNMLLGGTLCVLSKYAIFRGRWRVNDMLYLIFISCVRYVCLFFYPYIRLSVCLSFEPSV